MHARDLRRSADPSRSRPRRTSRWRRSPSRCVDCGEHLVVVGDHVEVHPAVDRTRVLGIVTAQTGRVHHRGRIPAPVATGPSDGSADQTQPEVHQCVGAGRTHRRDFLGRVLGQWRDRHPRRELQAERFALCLEERRVATPDRRTIEHHAHPRAPSVATCRARSTDSSSCEPTWRWNMNSLRARSVPAQLIVGMRARSARGVATRALSPIAGPTIITTPCSTSSAKACSIANAVPAGSPNPAASTNSTSRSSRPRSRRSSMAIRMIASRAYRRAPHPPRSSRPCRAGLRRVSVQSWDAASHVQTGHDCWGTRR